MKLSEVLFVIFTAICTSFAYDYNISNKKFPDNFWFGVATSAYQIEGGWNADGKGESYWDYFTHQTPSPITDGNNADIACDSYHKYETDVAMLKDLGVTHYKFSLSWPRILPSGFRKSLNREGVKYYKNLIKLLIHHDIKPVVTLYNWDIPRNIFDNGFMTNDSFPDWFADYARICYQNFGKHVQWWTTFNEPVWACQQFAEPDYNEYLCGHNLLKAHAAAWHVYDDEFRAAQGGKVSMVHAITWSAPASNSTIDIAAADRKVEFDLGWWANPIYHGDYPGIMKQRAKDRLPEFTAYEKAFIKDTSDYFCINTYSSQLVEDDSQPQRTLSPYTPSVRAPPTIITDLPPLTSPSNPSTQSVPTKDDEEGVKVYPNPNYTDGAWGLVPLTKWIQSHYNDPDILVTENGLGVDAVDDTLEDDNRITFIRNYLSAIRDAMDDDVKIFGYTLWSLMDSFEWNSGYSRKFGIYQVDFSSENRTRIPRKSVAWYRNLIKSRCLVDNCVE